jgi:hypothetical protein
MLSQQSSEPYNTQLQENTVEYTEEFPHIWDTTLVSTFRACEQKFYHEHILGLSGDPSFHLTAGRAFAAGCEQVRRQFYVHQRSPDEALASGLLKMLDEYDSIDIRIGADNPESKLYPKSWKRLSMALKCYFGEGDRSQVRTDSGSFKLGEDPYTPINTGDNSRGEPGIEFSGLLPIPLNHPETGQQLSFSIRFDGLCDGPFGLVGLDEKTGSSMDSLWASKWSLRGQFLNYIHVARELGYPIKGIVARGIILQKTQFHFPEGLVLPPDEVVKHCWKDTLATITRARDAWKSKRYVSAFGDPCNAFGGCQFRQICEAGGAAKDQYDLYAISRWHPELGERIWVRKLSDAIGNIDDDFWKSL